MIAQRLLVLAAPGYITGNADEHEKPVSDQAGNVGMLTRDREDITGRAAAGRMVRSIRTRKNSLSVLSGSGPTDLNYGKNCYVLS